MANGITSRALVVGINDYKDCPLQWCVNDAKEIEGILCMAEYGFSVTSRFDNEVSRNRLLEDLQNLFESDAQKLLFYFSGHGEITPYGAYLVTIDGTSIEPGLDLPLFARLVNAHSRPGRIVTIILDCCHSGAMSFRDKSRATRNLAREISNAFSSLPEGNLLLAACRPEEVALEDTTLCHGIFTFHLLEGLYGKAANEGGEITPSSLHDYVSRALAKNVVKQNMIFRGDISGRIVLGTGFAPIERKEYDLRIGRRLAQEGRKLVDKYQADVGRDFSNREVWAQSGFKSASQGLEPIKRWFEKKEEEYPELRQHKDFQNHSEEIIAWQARLSNLDGVRQTPWGEVVDRIGYGTFGTVWKIERRGENRQIEAYKVYHGQDIRLRDKMHRFRRGFEAMKMLDHPYIVKVGEFTECPIGFFMDYIDGSNFRDFTGTLEIDGQLKVLLTVAETLSHAHNRSVVHRDLKPENIIMKFDGENWHPFLTDFDLAWFSTASVITKEAIGSTFYSAPEQIYRPNSSASRSPKVDVYAFGKLCFYALTNTDPAPNVNDNVGALKQHLKRWIAGDAASALLRLYENAVVYDPEKRISDCRQICDELHRIIILCTADPEQTITSDRFVRETVFGLVGIIGNSHGQPNSFKSLSNHTYVDVQVRIEENDSISLTFRLEKLSQLLMEGIDYDLARNKLNRRVDEILSNFKNAKRRSGKSGIYEVYVDVNRVPMNFKGVENTRRLLARVIEAIEHE